MKKAATWLALGVLAAMNQDKMIGNAAHVDYKSYDPKFKQKKKKRKAARLSRRANRRNT